MMEVISYRNQSINFKRKSMAWFLYDRDLSNERVNFKILHGSFLPTICEKFKFLSLLI